MMLSLLSSRIAIQRQVCKKLFNLNQIFKINIERDDLQIELIINDFRRVLINIFENACDSLQTKISLQYDFEPNVEITIKEENNSVKISIKDNGIGVSKDELENIFLPFYTKKQAKKGVGLGLFFAREIIIGEHNGTIDIDSQPNEYCEFIICIPKNRMDK